MTVKEIEYYEIIQIGNINRYNKNTAYVEGKNPTIYEEAAKKKPDNRIPVPLAKSAVEDMTGFAASVGNIKIDFKENIDETNNEKDEREEYIELNKEIYNYNNSEIETTELYNQALTQGEAYELFWVSDELDVENGILTPEFALIDNSEVILIWSEEIKPKLNAVIRFRITGASKYAEVYYPKYMESWIRNIDEKDSPWKRNIDGDREYPYTSVPLAIYKINRTSQCLFEAEKAMIDAHDNLISKSVNEIDRFNALLALFPDSVDADFIRKLEEYKVVDNLGDYERWPEYLEKSLDKINTFYNDLADRLKKYIHMTMKVPDFSDENFAGNQSGVAIKYKLMGLEFKAAMIDAYFNAGLKQRNKLINEVLNSGTKEWDEYTITIDNKRNLPVDEVEKAEIAMKLMGVVSKETLLKYLPESIVKDTELELQKLENEVLQGIEGFNRKETE